MDTLTKRLILNLKEMTRIMKQNRPVMPFDENIKNLTLLQMDVIGYLCENHKARMTDLTKEAGVKMPTMTDVVDKLVKDGVLIRERDEKDRRTVWVKISPNVKRYAEKIMKKHEKYVENALSVLNKKEKEMAINMINKIIKNLKEGVK